MSLNVERVGMFRSQDDVPLFVINIYSSTTSAIERTHKPEFDRLALFVTTCWEERREPFRLHMGYFNSRMDGEALLGDVRKLHPAAWVGPAPTKHPVSRPGAGVGGRDNDASPPGAGPYKSATTENVASEEHSREEAQHREVLVTATGERTLEERSNVREVLAALNDVPQSNSMVLLATVESTVAPDISAQRAIFPNSAKSSAGKRVVDRPRESALGRAPPPEEALGISQSATLSQVAKKQGAANPGRVPGQVPIRCATKSGAARLVGLFLCLCERLGRSRG